jgi:transketolase
VGEDLSIESLEAAATAAVEEGGRPSLVIVRSHIGYGAPNKQDTEKAHGSPLGEEEVRLTKEAYGWPTEPPFLVPDEVLEHFREHAERGAGLVSEWEERLEAYRRKEPEAAAELELIVNRVLPDGWDADVPRFETDAGSVATRKASQQVIQWAGANVPQLVSGSADLEPSTLTVIDEGGSVAPGDFSGRNVHYGVREHSMGAVVNGLNLHGLRAFGSTFFNFLDYMKGAVRLASLMHLPVIWVYTHDSIGLGEDGPTHQPVEQLATLRAQPNTYCVRPADANETALAWRFAIAQTDTPTALVLSRQGLPTNDPDSVPADAVERGAYVLRESSRGPEADLILIGTGSEVHICVEAAELLEADGLATRVVSAPCLDRFAEQDDAYRDSVLPPSVRARLSVEAASPLGWSTWTTDDGDSVAMTTFGESAPQKDLYEHFGFTPENVAARGRAVAERVPARA